MIDNEDISEKNNDLAKLLQALRSKALSATANAQTVTKKPEEGGQKQVNGLVSKPSPSSQQLPSATPKVETSVDQRY